METATIQVLELSSNLSLTQNYGDAVTLTPSDTNQAMALVKVSSGNPVALGLVRQDMVNGTFPKHVVFAVENSAVAYPMKQVNTPAAANFSNMDRKCQVQLVMLPGSTDVWRLAAW